MNNVWSECIQGVGTLYKSRNLRFDDRFAHLYKSVFAIHESDKILEIGCGPGALSEALHRWYPLAGITAIDRDSNFIDFASANGSDIRYITADAAQLPFGDNTFDVTISNTVAEHISPDSFFGEQYRVLKKDGICIVMSSRKGINLPSETVSKIYPFENELWRITEERYEELNKKHGVCAYPCNESELPKRMAKYGFTNITTHYITINLTPDSSDTDREFALRIIEANRQTGIDAAMSLKNFAGDIVSEKEIQQLLYEINKKYDERIARYESGIKLWDTTVNLIMVVRGLK